MSHKHFPKSNTVRQIVTTAGAWLKLNNASVALSIPEGAIGKQLKQNVFLSVLNEDSLKVSIPDICTHIGPIIHCGPADVNLQKPAVLRIPHCAEMLDQWRVSLYYSNAHIQDIEPKWRKIVTLGEETINTPAYVQMDDKYACIMTDFLGRFALVGESLLYNGVGAVKRLKLFLFGPAVQPVADGTIRVYVIEDLPSSREYCNTLEQRQGGVYLGQSHALTFQDNGQDLNLSLKCVGGWRPKAGADSQIIPFSHVWNNGLALHCAFAIERSEQESPGLKIEISAKQRQGVGGVGCVGGGGEVTATHVAPFMPIDNGPPPMASLNQALSAIDEYGGVSGGGGSGSSGGGSVRSVTVSSTRSGGLMHNVTSAASSHHDSEIAFKLTRQARRELCACLDPPTTRGNDWRMLAQRLNVDRYITYFATKASPTDHILDLWECRSRESSALADLAAQLESMGRLDAVQILEKSMGPAWV